MSPGLLKSFFLSQARYAHAAVPVAGQAGNAFLGHFTPERYDDRIGASSAYSRWCGRWGTWPMRTAMTSRCAGW